METLSSRHFFIDNHLLLYRSNRERRRERRRKRGEENMEREKVQRWGGERKRGQRRGDGE